MRKRNVAGIAGLMLSILPWSVFAHAAWYPPD